MLTYEQTALELMEEVASGRIKDVQTQANIIASAQMYATLALVKATEAQTEMRRWLPR